jgi:hypothetical protein
MVDELNAQSRQASSRQNLTVRRKAADALDCTWYQFVRVSAASCRFLDSSPHAIDAVSAPIAYDFDPTHSSQHNVFIFFLVL